MNIPVKIVPPPISLKLDCVAETVRGATLEFNGSF